MSDWISIKDSIPKDKAKILITDGCHVTAAIADLSSFEDPWWDGCGFGGYEWDWDFERGDVTHWMPLPETPTA